MLGALGPVLIVTKIQGNFCFFWISYFLHWPEDTWETSCAVIFIMKPGGLWKHQSPKCHLKAKNRSRGDSFWSLHAKHNAQQDRQFLLSCLPGNVSSCWILSLMWIQWPVHSSLHLSSRVCVLWEAMTVIWVELCADWMYYLNFSCSERSAFAWRQKSGLLNINVIMHPMGVRARGRVV